MNPFEIFITYISWGIGGKSRPVLVYSQDSLKIAVYSITTQYDNKSETIKAKYFKIEDWEQSGLSKLSYVDIGTLFRLPISVIDHKNPIGKLSASDIKRFLEFLDE